MNIQQAAKTSGVVSGRATSSRQPSKLIGSVELPKELARQLDHPEGFRFGAVRAERHLCPESNGFYRVDVVASLGHRTAARRFLKELQKLAFVELVRATQDTSTDAGLAGQI